MNNNEAQRPQKNPSSLWRHENPTHLVKTVIGNPGQSTSVLFVRQTAERASNATLIRFLIKPLLVEHPWIGVSSQLVTARRVQKVLSVRILFLPDNPH